MSLRYVTGDATRPEGDGARIIVHCCNSHGVWGAGFVLALSRRWPGPERQYRAWLDSAEKKGQLPLGAVQFVGVEDGLVVANLIGQEGVGHAPDGTPPIRYPAIRTGLATVREEAMRWALSSSRRRASIHMPRMGAGLAGGDWARIERIVRNELVERDLDVTVYDRPT
jgi:O-acetyl-ADP-ribose deacetylase (regulator of RNase III)